MINKLIVSMPELAPWTLSTGELVEFVPFEKSFELESITHAYAIPFLENNNCLIPRRGDGRWWIAGGTVEQSETWRETLERELLEELGAKITYFEPFGAYRTIGEVVTYRVVSWANIDCFTEPVDPDGAVGIVERREIHPEEAMSFYDDEFKNFGSVYSLAHVLRKAHF